MVEELKIKERVKPKAKQDFDEAINKMLTKTIFNGSSFVSQVKDRVNDMIQT